METTTSNLKEKVRDEELFHRWVPKKSDEALTEEYLRIYSDTGTL